MLTVIELFHKYGKIQGYLCVHYEQNKKLCYSEICIGLVLRRILAFFVNKS